MTRTPTMRGGVLVLIILIMVSLSMFSVLAWVSANGDLKMAEKNAGWIKQYYELDVMGTEALTAAKKLVAEGASLESLSGLGWAVDGGSAAIDLEIGGDDSADGGPSRAQRLHIEVVPDGAGGLRVTQWLQRQDRLPDDSDWNDIIIIE